MGEKTNLNMEFENKALANGELSNGELSNGELSNGELSNGELSNDKLSNKKLKNIKETINFGENSDLNEFTEKEKQILQQYFSNTEKPIFVLKKLPDVVKGTLFSRYSRSEKSLRKLLLDEFINNKDLEFEELATTEIIQDSKILEEKAQKFYERVLDGYGDDSVAELGGAHLAVESISNVAVKLLEDSRIGGSPLEKSSRYVKFDNKKNGKYQYYREPKIMQSKYAKEYEETMDLLFETYKNLYKKIDKYQRNASPIEEFEFTTNYETKEKKKYSEIQDEKQKQKAKTAYETSVKAKVCDVIRYLLPASTLTNVGFFGNGRFYGTMLNKCYSYPLAEMNEIGKEIHEELNKTIPSFVRRSKKDEYLIHQNQNQQKTIIKNQQEKTKKEKRVKLIEYEKNAERKIATYCIFTTTNQSLTECKNKTKKMTNQEIKQIIESYVGKRNNRRNRPGRAFENVYYTFEINADYGAFRDLHRHRILTQERQLLSCFHGYETPEEITKAKVKKEYKNAMEKANKLWEKLYSEMPFEAQYAVPFGYKIKWYIKMNLREAIHLIELRSVPQGHPSYRKIAQQMYLEIKKIHPELAKTIQYVDMNDYQIGRLDSESKKEAKKTN